MPMIVVLQAEGWSGMLARLETLGRDAGQGAVNAALALAVMLVGWAIATLGAGLLRVTLRWLRFNAAMHQLFGARVIERHEPAGVAAWAAYWVVLASAGLAALETLGFSLAASIAARLAEVLPRIVTSAGLFAVGVVVALLAGAITRRFLESADLRAAKLQGQIVTAVLTGFAALVALEQLGFAAQFVMALGIVAVAAAGMALALAFGLGCRELARDFLVEYLKSLDDDTTMKPR